ncbi:type 4a pilus biogenesis protein PilO [Patescibacteria group bacterium]|nr:type 4a pilus biogenesis protein PilO [Patescibacteria group bacterium]
MEIDRSIIIAIIIFITLVSIFYLVSPKYRELQGVLLEVGKKEVEFESKSAYFIEITSVYKELMNYQDSLNKIETALPSKFSLPSLVNFLYKKGAESGVVIKRVSAGKSSPVGKETNIKETSLSLSIIGSYTSLENFITSIEKSARLIEGENISFSIGLPTTENSQPSQNYPIDLQIKVYSYQPS